VSGCSTVNYPPGVRRSLLTIAPKLYGFTVDDIRGVRGRAKAVRWSPVDAAVEYNFTPTVIEAFERGSVKVPKAIARDIGFRAAVQERHEVLATCPATLLRRQEGSGTKSGRTSNQCVLRCAAANLEWRREVQSRSLVILWRTESSGCEELFGLS
jgi:hypothetical protein